MPTVRGAENSNSKPVQAIKGTVNNPIDRKQIDRAREVILDELRERDDTPRTVTLSGNPIPANKDLVGYGITIENGAPLERRYTIDSTLRSRGAADAIERLDQTVNAQRKSVDEFIDTHQGGR